MTVQRRDYANLAWLICIQGSNAALPLIIFPFALASVGAEPYSKIVLAETISMIVLTLVTYSFEVDGAARVVDLNVESESEAISCEFSAILYARLLIFTVCSLIVLLLLFFIRRDLLELCLWWLLVPLSFIFQSFWLFQAIERTWHVALFSAISRLACIVAIFLNVRGADDYMLVPAFIGVCFLAGSLATLFIAAIFLKIRLRYVPIESIRRRLVEGRVVFLGNASVLLYRDINVVLLNLVGAGADAIAGYSLAEKLVKGLQALVRPLNQLFYPKVIRLLREHRGISRFYLREIAKLIVPQLVGLALFLILISAILFAVRWNIQFERFFPLQPWWPLLIMSIGTFFGVANFMLGVAGLNNLGERAYFLKSVLMTGLASVITCLVLGWALGAVGAALSFLISEVMLFSLVVLRYLK